MMNSTIKKKEQIKLVLALNYYQKNQQTALTIINYIIAQEIFIHLKKHLQ